MKNNSHVKRIFALLFVAGLIGLGVRHLLLPRTFGAIGHYRADSLKDILKLEHIYRGKEACAPCHDNYDVLKKDVHFGAQCENCHGPGNAHIAQIDAFLQQNNLKPAPSGRYLKDTLAAVPKQLTGMPKEYTLEGCLYCHRKLESRPRDFAQIAPTEHYKFLHVNDNSIRCVECHNPHQPLFLLNPVSEAKIHPIIYECEQCHRKRPEKNYKDVANHPVIFECEDCHAAIVRDFKKREHASIRCTACHLFHRENEMSGRIYKNGNKQFCLLCHEKKPFKDQAGIHQIDPATHLEKMPGVMQKDANAIMRSQTACMECHYNFIHDANLVKTLREQKEWAKHAVL